MRYRVLSRRPYRRAGRRGYALAGADGEISEDDASSRASCHLGAYEGPGIRSSRCDPTPAQPRRLDRFCRRILSRAVHVKDQPLHLYASELSALAEDDRIEYMPVAARIRKGAGLGATTMRRGRGRSRWGGGLLTLTGD
jgi:hypothetical protein